MIMQIVVILLLIKTAASQHKERSANKRKERKMGDSEINTPISFCTKPINMFKVATKKHKIHIKTKDNTDNSVRKEKIRISMAKYNDTENKILLMTCKEMLNVVDTYGLLGQEDGKKVF